MLVPRGRQGFISITRVVMSQTLKKGHGQVHFRLGVKNYLQNQIHLFPKQNRLHALSNPSFPYLNRFYESNMRVILA